MEIKRLCISIPVHLAKSLLKYALLITTKRTEIYMTLTTPKTPVMPKSLVKSRLINALNALQNTHGSSSFFLKVTDESLALLSQSFLPILCLPLNPFLNGHLLLRAGQFANWSPGIFLFATRTEENSLDVDWSPGL